MNRIIEKLISLFRFTRQTNVLPHQTGPEANEFERRRTTGGAVPAKWKPVGANQ